MHEILDSLPAGSFVLDLGCADGSFAESATRANVVRVDRNRLQNKGGRFVQADAAMLPFPDGAFMAIISNHSLEHICDIHGSLREIRRVLRSEGALYIAVPDASTLTDRIYRWLSRGGGHVNAFISPAELAAGVEAATGFRHVTTRTLCSSLSFLNRRIAPRPLPRRLLLLGGGYEWSLFTYAWFSRRLDHWLGTRMSVYGWALYFGTIEPPDTTIDTKIRRNVCIRCGAGHAASFLEACSLVRSRLGIRVYRCPGCGATNPFSPD